MQRILIPTALLLVIGSMGVTRVQHLERNIDQLETSRGEVPKRLMELRSEMEASQGEWQDAIASLQTELSDLGQSKREREGALVSQLQEATASLEVERDRMADMQRMLEDKQYESTLNEVNERFDGLSESMSSAINMVQSTRADLGRIQDAMQPEEAEVHHRWRRIVGPTVQLSGDTTVGSGVVLRSTPLEDGSGYETLVVTAWHVVRDILADKINPMDKDVPVAIYLEDGTVVHRTAQLIGKNAVIDAALLVLDGTEPVPNGATLASRSYLKSRSIFHPIYAVGCPLGNDPIPTPGELSDLDHYIDGSTYWMISAPTYIGNSGGGIYDGASNHLMGLFSKIYTHGNIRPTIVPHMGLVSPLALVYQWLEDDHIAQVIDNGDVATIVVTRD